jgi:hypothetical protein
MQYPTMIQATGAIKLMMLLLGFAWGVAVDLATVAVGLFSAMTDGFKFFTGFY